MSAPLARESESAHDELLAGLLAELAEQLRNGHKPDFEAVVRQHPELAGELRELWAAVQVAEELGKSSASACTVDQAPKAATPAKPQAATALPRVFGDYELVEEIGRGGMGVVFKAHQRSLNRTVALKMILAGQLASPAEVQRFRAEAEHAARLDHPHIVPIYEVGEHQGQHFFAMRLVEG